MQSFSFASYSQENKATNRIAARTLSGFGVWLAVGLAAILLFPGTLLAQTPVTTWHYDNARTSANTTETLLTPANVKFANFGKLFSDPVDGIVVGHPLYLPQVSIPGQGIHNVLYVATLHDSVYAFDADAPGAPLWTTSILAYSPPGATPVPASVKQSATTTGWSEVGIVSTPVIDPPTAIDPAAGTLYLVAETYENSKVVHRLHALDVTTGLEKLGGPTTITASYTLNGVTSTMPDLFEMNRPGLLLDHGHIYIAWGSNCCNGYSQGWVLAYNAQTLQQEGAFDAEPGKALASIWQTGAGISADSAGNVYAETSEGFYAAGTNLSTSVLKLTLQQTQTGSSLTLADWFTPFNHQYLSSNDLDMAEGVLILPDNQPGPNPNEAIAVGKQGTVYVLNRDSMGHLCAACTSTTGDTQIIQELRNAVGFESGTPVFWNNTVYFDGQSSPVLAYSLSNGQLVLPPVAQSMKIGGGGNALITASGNSNGILWMINGKSMMAMDAQSLKVLYTTVQAPNGRDTPPPLAHFATPIAADGRVFLGTQNSVVVYGLFPDLAVAAGNQQSAMVTQSVNVEVQAIDPYTQNPIPGITVTFSDGGKGGSFSSSTVVTDSSGMAPTSYTFPTKSGTYTLTGTAPGFAPATFTETALPGPAKMLVGWSGTGQSAPVATALKSAIVTKASDAFSNGVPGVVVTYSDNLIGGSFSGNPVTTTSTGFASVTYTNPTVAGKHKIVASATGLTSVTFLETATAGAPAAIATVSGNNQAAAPSTTLSQPLVVKVTDQYGNTVPNAAVTFDDGGAGGSFSANPVSTASNGTASVNYTTPPATGTVTINATVSGVSGAAAFTVTVQ